MSRSYGQPWSASPDERRLRQAMGTLDQRERDLLNMYAHGSISLTHPGVEDALSALKEALS